MTDRTADRPQLGSRRVARQLGARQRRGDARHRHERQRRLRFPRGGQPHHPADLRPGRPARRRRGGPGRLSRPGRLRPALHRHGADELTADVIYQIGALEAMCKVAGTRVEYVKPHGALYNAIVEHETQAAAVVAAVVAVDPSLPVMGLPGSVFLGSRPRPACARCPRRSRTARTRRRATSSHAASRAPSCTIRARSQPGWCASPSRAGSPRSTARSSRSERTPSAPTATHRVPSTSPGLFGPP